MRRRKRRFRLNPRFFIILFVLAAVAGGAYYLLSHGKKSGTLKLDTVSMDLQVSGVVVRDETTVSTDKFEKVVFHALEGEIIDDNTLVATVYRMGYQDESMVTILNLEKEIYNQQSILIGTGDETLNTLNRKIKAVEQMVRDVNRGDSEQDVLSLQDQLSGLQMERSTYLSSAVTPDSYLTGLQTQLSDQKSMISNWTRDFVNTAGRGIISFYFDGYENVLSTSKLSTINVSLVKNVVRGANTAKEVSSSSSSMLYRLTVPNHWFVAFATNIDDPFRVTEGERYNVKFNDYSETVYQAIARAPIVFTIDTGDEEEETTTGQGVVNILEFNTDIGSFAGIRTVNMTVSAAAEGISVDNELISFVNGKPCLFVKNGDAITQVDITVLAKGEEKSVIREAGDVKFLTAGQKVVKE